MTLFDTPPPHTHTHTLQRTHTSDLEQFNAGPKVVLCN